MTPKKEPMAKSPGVKVSTPDNVFNNMRSIVDRHFQNNYNGKP